MAIDFRSEEYPSVCRDGPTDSRPFLIARQTFGITLGPEHDTATVVLLDAEWVATYSR
jgi:hypothetical protein